MQKIWKNGEKIISYGVYCDSESEPTPLDKVKVAIMELPTKDKHEIYKFLYALGHRISQ